MKSKAEEKKGFKGKAEDDKKRSRSVQVSLDFVI